MNVKWGSKPRTEVVVEGVSWSVAQTPEDVTCRMLYIFVIIFGCWWLTAFSLFSLPHSSLLFLLSCTSSSFFLSHQFFLPLFSSFYFLLFFLLLHTLSCFLFPLPLYMFVAYNMMLSACLACLYMLVGGNLNVPSLLCLRGQFRVVKWNQRS